MRNFVISILLFILLFGCGERSTIKVEVEPRALGDGTHVTLPIVVPLSEKSISSFESPVSGVSPILRGFVSSIMNLGASMGAGKKRLTLIQPLPEIPENLASIKIKRIFFFIEAERRSENFKFLRRLAVKLSPTDIKRTQSGWEPTIETNSMDDEELNLFWSLFKTKRDKNAEEWEKNSTGLMLIKYDEDNKRESLQGKRVGPVHIIHTETPGQTRKYLENSYGDFLTRIHTLNSSILVELKKNPIEEEIFKTKFSSDAEMLEDLEIGEIDLCDEKVCLDLKVPNVNLIPLLRGGNGLKIEAYIDPKKAPKSFQLKGFLEFEVKIKSKL